MLLSSFNDSTYQMVYEILIPPAAGVDITFNVPVNSFIQPVTFHCDLVTDATVAIRHVFMRLYFGAIMFTHTETLQAQAASLTMSYTFGISGANAFTGAGTGGVYVPMLDQIHMDHINSLLISANNLQAGDQFTSANISYKRWIIEQ